MKRRSFVGALAALVAAPKALLGMKPASLTQFPEPIIGASLTPDVWDGVTTELQVWHGDTSCEQLVWNRDLSAEQILQTDDYIHQKYGEPLNGIPLDLRWAKNVPRHIRP